MSPGSLPRNPGRCFPNRRNRPAAARTIPSNRIVLPRAWVMSDGMPRRIIGEGRGEDEVDSTLSAILRPRSIAVVGASRHETSIGREILHNLIEYGFSGPLYPVNPNAASIHSIRCYPSLRDIPEP